MGNKENLEIINNILLKAPREERETTVEDWIYRKNFYKFEEDKIKYQKAIRKTGIVELMEIVREAETVTLFGNEKAEIQINPLWPEAILIFNQIGCGHGTAQDEVSAKFNKEGRLVINGAKSVVVDDKSNLAKIFGEALAEPKRVFRQTRGFAGRPLYRGG